MAVHKCPIVARALALVMVTVMAVRSCVRSLKSKPKRGASLTWTRTMARFITPRAKRQHVCATIPVDQSERYSGYYSPGDVIHGCASMTGSGMGCAAFGFGNGPGDPWFCGVIEEQAKPGGCDGVREYESDVGGKGGGQSGTLYFFSCVAPPRSPPLPPSLPPPSPLPPPPLPPTCKVGDCWSVGCPVRLIPGICANTDN